MSIGELSGKFASSYLRRGNLRTGRLGEKTPRGGSAASFCRSLRDCRCCSFKDFSLEFSPPLGRSAKRLRGTKGVPRKGV